LAFDPELFWATLCLLSEPISGDDIREFDDFVGSGEHDSSAQIFLVGKNRGASDT
jgi:hypothetical protein